MSVSETAKGTRVRKMNGLTEGKYEEDLEIALKKEFNFQSDLDLLMDAFDEKLESRTIDLGRNQQSSNCRGARNDIE